MIFPRGEGYSRKGMKMRRFSTVSIPTIPVSSGGSPIISTE
jgi:hypothetical protein